MAVYTKTKTYKTRAHMGMIDITEDFQAAVTEACREKGITAPLHSAQFDIDESCLKLGVRIQTLLALRLLSRLPGQEK